MSQSLRVTGAVAFLLVCTMLTVCSAEDPIGEAFAKLSLTPEQVRIERADLAFRGEKDYTAIPLLDACREKPFRMSEFCSVSGESLLTAPSSMRMLTNFASTRTGHGQYRGFIVDPTEEWTKGNTNLEMLNLELERLFEAYDSKWSSKSKKKLIEDWASIPAEVVTSVILYIRAAKSAIEWRQKAFRALPAGVSPTVLYHELVREHTFVQARENATPASEHPAGQIASMVDLYRSIDFELLFTGGQEIAIAVDEIRKRLDPVKGSGGVFNQVIDTPLGRIAVGGTGENFYPDAVEYLLAIDLGGNDNYRGGGANLSWKNPVSSVVDMAGDDIYMNELVTPAFGAGILGYGFLLDAGGNDYYKLTSLGLGAGLYGVGGLIDEDGTDTYLSVSYSIASANFGVGVLRDGGGGDKYEAFNCSMGFGGVLGCGLLVDVAGDDLYIARNDEIRFPSAQSAEHNSSMSIGAGFGRRADFLDGHSLNGGFGMVADGGGDDKYSGGVFAIAVGYWGGVGMVYDKAGNDSYTGAWYTIAATAHFAVSALVDKAGNDSYTATLNMAIGAAHDYSASSFLEVEGNDRYSAPNLSLGAGNENSIGIFIELAGDDSYSSRGLTLGAAKNAATAPTSLRWYSLCFAMFTDRGGRDSYELKDISPREGEAKDGGAWYHKVTQSPYEKAFGFDGEYPGGPGIR